MTNLSERQLLFMRAVISQDYGFIYTNDLFCQELYDTLAYESFTLVDAKLVAEGQQEMVIISEPRSGYAQLVRLWTGHPLLYGSGSNIDGYSVGCFHASTNSYCARPGVTEGDDIEWMFMREAVLSVNRFDGSVEQLHFVIATELLYNHFVEVFAKFGLKVLDGEISVM